MKNPHKHKFNLDKYVKVMGTSKKIPYVKKIDTDTCPSETVDIINKNFSSIANAFKAEFNGIHSVGDIKTSLNKADENGWYVCDGRAFDLQVFPQLKTLISQGVLTQIGPGVVLLPDLRGRFLRGWDGNSGRDPDAKDRYNIIGNKVGNIIGSYQDHAQELEHEEFDYFYTYTDTNQYPRIRTKTRKLTFVITHGEHPRIIADGTPAQDNLQRETMGFIYELNQTPVAQNNTVRSKIEPVKKAKRPDRDLHELNTPINEYGTVKGIAPKDSGLNNSVESRPKNISAVYKIFIGEPFLCIPEDLPEWNVEDANVWFPANFDEPLDFSLLSPLSALDYEASCDPLNPDLNLDVTDLDFI